MAFNITLQELRVSGTKMALIVVIYKQMCNQPLLTSNILRMETALKAHLLNYWQSVVWFKIVSLGNQWAAYDGESSCFTSIALVSIKTIITVRYVYSHIYGNNRSIKTIITVRYVNFRFVSNKRQTWFCCWKVGVREVLYSL
jgi:hypothetical protein